MFLHGTFRPFRTSERSEPRGCLFRTRNVRNVPNVPSPQVVCSEQNVRNISEQLFVPNGRNTVPNNCSRVRNSSEHCSERSEPRRCLFRTRNVPNVRNVRNVPTVFPGLFGTLFRPFLPEFCSVFGTFGTFRTFRTPSDHCSRRA